MQQAKKKGLECRININEEKNQQSTKFLEDYANLTIFKQETPSISGIARATLLVEKLSNVPRIARWKELRGTDYPSFVHEVLDKDETSENKVST